MERREIGALNDMTVATEFLMVAVREIARGAAVSTPAVQEYLGYAVRLLRPMDMGREPAPPARSHAKKAPEK